jgi:DNA helicase-2/ATP-dependent DNA helicase PcrA
LVNNPRDDVNFKRVVNVPRRGIGRVTLERIEKAAGEESLCLSLRKKGALGEVPKLQRERVEEFTMLIANLELMARKATAHDVLVEIIDRTGYREYLQEDPKTAQTRLENVEELLVETHRFALAAEDPRLPSFLEEIALISDIDTLKSEETVALMTLHNSKGLEYRSVLITGLEDGLLPHYSSFDDDEELEEERRLLYVGMTRAKEMLFLFSSANRLRFGNWTGNKPSRFLDEIPMELVEVTSEKGMTRAGQELFKSIDAPSVPQEREVVVQSKRFYAGAHVLHPTYGQGTIRKVEGSGRDMRVTVYFPGSGEKKFLALYAPFQFLR